MTNHEATYSPGDNKLRLYPAARLSEAEYNRVKAHGFKWAPKQGIFVAPMWTPERADLLTEMCDDIGDEDKSLSERADERAERFEEYSEKRAGEARATRRAVSAITEHIPFGQPILIGHHSEKHARRDAERIESGMRKAVKAWETSQYWESRAARAVAHAEYKELPAVRARRIKTIEADKRKQEKYIADAEKWLKAWNTPGLTLEKARAIAGYCHLTVTRKNADGSDADNFGGWSAYNVLQPDGERYQRCPAMTVADCVAAANRAYPATIEHCRRWVEHYDFRLAYERAMLRESGGTVTDKTGPQKGGGARCWASPRGGWSYIQKVNKVSVTVLDNWGNGGGNFTRTIPFDKLIEIMTPEQIAEARDAGRLHDTADGTGFIVAAPEADTVCPDAECIAERDKIAGAADFDAMRDTLKAGVQITIAPQLYPTPEPLAARMVQLAELTPECHVMEPSAGTGNLLKAIKDAGIPARLSACELNLKLADDLAGKFQGALIYPGDFLELTGWELGAPFDRILMNPPFSDGADIKHIRHAATMLKPGGKLIAICANGPRQQAALRNDADVWEELPAGTFKHAGTMVNTALLVISNQGAQS